LGIFIEYKICCHCKKKLSIINFSSDISRKDGLCAQCKTCHRKATSNYYNRVKDYVGYKDKANQASKKWSDNLKLTVFKHYSNGELECSICKCNDYRVLNIDHINGGGLKHRREIGFGGANFFRWLTKNNFPDGYRVLCRNCNWIAHLEKQSKSK
jgi:hypothetical protein